jgi:hypothetical protein
MKVAVERKHKYFNARDTSSIPGSELMEEIKRDSVRLSKDTLEESKYGIEIVLAFRIEISV